VAGIVTENGSQLGGLSDKAGVPIRPLALGYALYIGSVDKLEPGQTSPVLRAIVLITVSI
jgi:hypothetical protein